MSIRQLELFGLPEEDKPVVAPKPKPEKNVASQKENANNQMPPSVIDQEVTADNQTVAIQADPPVYPEPAAASNNNVVFEDNKIVVKIKPKVVKAEPVPTPEVDPIAEKKKELPTESKYPERRQVTPSKKRGRKSFKEIESEISLVQVPDDEELFQKQYYPISVVASWFNVNTSLLRYWENEFDILKPRKNRKGDRLFRPEDVKNIQVIYYLLRQRKFTIEGAKDYLKINKKKADINLQIIQSLNKFRSFLLELKAGIIE